MTVILAYMAALFTFASATLWIRRSYERSLCTAGTVPGWLAGLERVRQYLANESD